MALALVLASASALASVSCWRRRRRWCRRWRWRWRRCWRRRRRWRRRWCWRRRRRWRWRRCRRGVGVGVALASASRIQSAESTQLPDHGRTNVPALSRFRRRRIPAFRENLHWYEPPEVVRKTASLRLCFHHVIKSLRRAFEYESILIGDRNCSIRLYNSGLPNRGSLDDNLVIGSRHPFDCCKRISQTVIKLKGIIITDRNDADARIVRLQILKQVGKKLRLGLAFRPYENACTADDLSVDKRAKMIYHDTYRHVRTSGRMLRAQNERWTIVQ